MIDFGSPLAQLLSRLHACGRLSSVYGIEFRDWLDGAEFVPPREREDMQDLTFPDRDDYYRVGKAWHYTLEINFTGTTERIEILGDDAPAMFELMGRIACSKKLKDVEIQ